MNLPIGEDKVNVLDHKKIVRLISEISKAFDSTVILLLYDLYIQYIYNMHC